MNSHKGVQTIPLQESFFKCLDLLQYQHFNLPFFPLDFDLDGFFEFCPCSLGCPLVATASVDYDPMLLALCNSSINIVPTILP